MLWRLTNRRIIIIIICDKCTKNSETAKNEPTCIGLHSTYCMQYYITYGIPQISITEYGTALLSIITKPEPRSVAAGFDRHGVPLPASNGTSTAFCLRN